MLEMTKTTTILIKNLAIDYDTVTRSKRGDINDF